MRKRSLGLSFNGADGMALDFGTRRDGFFTQVQKVLVNLATDRGSDAYHPQRGTDLLARAVAGRLRSSAVSPAQYAGFAATDTLFFQRGSDDMSDSDRLASVRLQVTGLQRGRMDLKADMVSLSGASAGISATV